MFDLNNREIAILVWVLVLVGAFSLNAEVRKSFAGVIRALFQRLILIAIGTVLLWTGLCVAVLATFGLWELSNLKTTMMWMTTYALVTLFSINSIAEKPKTLSSLAKQAVAVTTIVVFIGEFHTLPLWGELLLVPSLALTGMMMAIAETKPETKNVAKLMENLLILAGLGMLAFSVYQIASDFQEFASLDTLRDFAVPALLSLMYLPFLYAVLLFMTYENALVGLKFKFEDSKLHRYAVLRAMIVLGGNLELLRRFKRSMNLADELDRASVDTVLREIWITYKREQNPPYVPWEKGWSPFTARRFLKAHGLKTNDYHRFVVDWLADSKSIEVDDGLIPSRVTYRIYGTEIFATRLTLTLDVNERGNPAIADEQFWPIANSLLFETLGNEAVEKFQEQGVSQNNCAFKHRGADVELEQDYWGLDSSGGYSRRLIICHPAHVPGVNG